MESVRINGPLLKNESEYAFDKSDGCYEGDLKNDGELLEYAGLGFTRCGLAI